MHCDNNLKQIGLALRQYQRRYSCLPPAFVPDANGKPMHSWRVLLLPFLDQDALYQKYSFKEPWDGPNNRKLSNVSIGVYKCTSDAPEYANTSYVAVVGPGTAWPGATGARLGDVQTDPGNTVLVVEVADSGVNWMEPRDLSFENMDFHVNGQPRNSISSRHRGDATVLFVDGSVGRLGDGLTPEAIRAMLRITGATGVRQKLRRSPRALYGILLDAMTAKQFYDWQTSGGTDDVMRLVDCLERADIAWCAIGGVAVNHWAKEPMVTQDVRSRRRCRRR